jgi:hypothetical protein
VHTFEFRVPPGALQSTPEFSPSVIDRAQPRPATFCAHKLRRARSKFCVSESATILRCSGIGVLGRGSYRLVVR